MFAGRFQTKAQDLDVDDHEVKVRLPLYYLRIETKKKLFSDKTLNNLFCSIL